MLNATCRSRTSSSMRSAPTRVEGSAQAVADRVEGQHDEGDGETRKHRAPRSFEENVASVGDQGAEFGGRRLRAEAKEAHPSDGEDGPSGVEAGLDGERTERVGQNMMYQDVGVGCPMPRAALSPMNPDY